MTTKTSDAAREPLKSRVNNIPSVFETDEAMARRVRNLNILLPRIQAICQRWGGPQPHRAIFEKMSDRQLMEDILYPVGAPIGSSRPAWYHGKAAMQLKQQKQLGHIFEFAVPHKPARIVLGDENDLEMDIEVIIHAWMGHAAVFANNIWHEETEQESNFEFLAQNAAFAKALISDPDYGLDKYEYYDDAAHALVLHSGMLPTPKGPSDEELRKELSERLLRLQDEFRLATTQPQKERIAEDIKDTAKLLSCHPIVPTSDILGFFAQEGNCDRQGITDKERRIAIATRYEDRQMTEVVGRTKTLHEGASHYMDRRIWLEPELDAARLGFDSLMRFAQYDCMHDSYPVYTYSDPYKFGEMLMAHIDEKHSKKIGTTKVTGWRHLKLLTQADIDSGQYPPETVETSIGKVTWVFKAGDIVETDEWIEKEVEVWDRSVLWEVWNYHDDYRLFTTYFTDDFFEKVHKNVLTWIDKMIMTINKVLKDRGWDPEIIFEGDRYPKSLIEMYIVTITWYWQIMLSGLVRWFGYGGPEFPVSMVTLWQMLQLIIFIWSYDSNKDELKRQMRLRTSLLAVPNIKIVDTGKYNSAPRWTLRHEYDEDFGDLKPSTARETLRMHWRWSGPCRLVTMKTLTDVWGRPWGPARPYQYYTDNGKTVIETWKPHNNH